MDEYLESPDEGDEIYVYFPAYGSVTYIQGGKVVEKTDTAIRVEAETGWPDTDSLVRAFPLGIPAYCLFFSKERKR